MDKKEIFDALDDFSQNILATLAEVAAIKKELQDVIEENTALRLENAKLRERLEKEVAANPKSSKFGIDNLVKVYNDGFHVCNAYYGQRDTSNSVCLECDELLNRN